LTPAQVRIVSLLTARHWKAAYPWSAQAAIALAAGLDRAVIEAINAGEQPNFTDSADQMVYTVARELLATGSLGDDIFQAAESTIGYQRLADLIGVIGHFTTTAMMANVVGAEPRADAPSLLKR
jgi:4-carboxymuconolactone decarboxylase